MGQSSNLENCYNWQLPFSFDDQKQNSQSRTDVFDIDSSQNIIACGIAQLTTLNNFGNTLFFQYQGINDVKWLRTSQNNELQQIMSVKIQRIYNSNQKILSIYQLNDGQNHLILLNSTDGNLIKMYREASDYPNSLYQINQHNSIYFTDDDLLYITAFNKNQMINVIACLDLNNLKAQLDQKWSKVIDSSKGNYQLLSIFIDENELYLNFKSTYVYDSFTHGTTLGLIKFELMTVQQVQAYAFQNNKTFEDSSKTYISEFDIFKDKDSQVDYLGICLHTQKNNETDYWMQFLLIKANQSSGQKDTKFTEIKIEQRCRDVKMQNGEKLLVVASINIELFIKLVIYRISFINQTKVSIVQTSVTQINSRLTLHAIIMDENYIIYSGASSYGYSKTSSVVNTNNRNFSCARDNQPDQTISYNLQLSKQYLMMELEELNLFREGNIVFQDNALQILRQQESSQFFKTYTDLCDSKSKINALDQMNLKSFIQDPNEVITDLNKFIYGDENCQDQKRYFIFSRQQSQNKFRLENGLLMLSYNDREIYNQP